MKIKLILLLTSLLFIGCATIKPISSEEYQHIYAVDYETAWAKSITMLNQENFPIKYFDKANGLIHSDYNKNYMQDSWMSYARYSLSLSISPINKEKTRIILTPHYEAYLTGHISAPPSGPNIDSGEWIMKTNRDRELVNKYFAKLDTLISAPVLVTSQ